MTRHYFTNDLVNLHYYKFGNGPKSMLCFHGYGMHGRQFKALAPALGAVYTFYGFDLFFHKETKLADQSINAVKKGLTKRGLAALFSKFCQAQGIERFSVIGYSMGSHYATVITEELAPMIDEYIVAAPSSLNPGKLIPFFSKNRAGNKVLEKLVLNKNGLVNLLKLFHKMRVIDDETYNILYNEIGTAELRFNLYACFTYLRLLETDEPRLLSALKDNNIKSIFIFGRRDKSFPYQPGNRFLKQLSDAVIVVLDEGHDMIKADFVTSLTNLLG